MFLTPCLADGRVCSVLCGPLARVDGMQAGSLTVPALNPLACRPGDGDGQEQTICGIFVRLLARFWGPRTEDIWAVETDLYVW